MSLLFFFVAIESWTMLMLFRQLCSDKLCTQKVRLLLKSLFLCCCWFIDSTGYFASSCLGFHRLLACWKCLVSASLSANMRFCPALLWSIVLVKGSIVAERSLPLGLLTPWFRRLIRFNLFGILSATMIAESRQVYHFELKWLEPINVEKVQFNQ